MCTRKQTTLRTYTCTRGQDRPKQETTHLFPLLLFDAGSPRLKRGELLLGLLWRRFSAGAELRLRRTIFLNSSSLLFAVESLLICRGARPVRQHPTFPPQNGTCCCSRSFRVFFPRRSARSRRPRRSRCIVIGVDLAVVFVLILPLFSFSPSSQPSPSPRLTVFLLLAFVARSRFCRCGSCW